MLHHVTFRLVHEVERDRMRTFLKVCVMLGLETETGTCQGTLCLSKQRGYHTRASIDGVCGRLWKGFYDVSS